jgi:hypothetical protein
LLPKIQGSSGHTNYALWAYDNAYVATWLDKRQQIMVAMTGVWFDWLDNTID